MLDAKREYTKTEYFIKVQRGASLIAYSAETHDDPASAIREAGDKIATGEAYVEIHKRVVHSTEEKMGSFGVMRPLTMGERVEAIIASGEPTLRLKDGPGRPG